MATKTAKKKTVASTASVSTKTTKAPLASKETPVKTKHSRPALVIIGVIFLSLFAIFVIKNFLIAATVNGEAITRLAIVKELEKQGGKQTLESMVTKVLVLQEAKKRNIVVSQEEIDAEIKKIEESLKGQNTTLDAALALQGMTRSDLITDIRLQLTVQKLVESKVSVNDEELKKYIEENQSFFPEGTSEEEKLSQARESLKQQKMATETQRLIEELQKNAKTVYFVSY